MWNVYILLCHHYLFVIHVISMLVFVSPQVMFLLSSIILYDTVIQIPNVPQVAVLTDSLHSTSSESKYLQHLPSVFLVYSTVDYFRLEFSILCISNAWKHIVLATMSTTVTFLFHNLFSVLLSCSFERL